MQLRPTFSFSLCLRVIAIALVLGCAAFLQFGPTAAEPPAISDAPALAEADVPALSPEELEALWKTAEKLEPAAAPANDPEAPAPLQVTIDESLIQWKVLDEGLELLELGLVKSGPGTLALAPLAAPAADLIILRVDPEHYEFTLHMASEDGQQRTLAEHATLHGLTAAINAGMYLPDNLTNTGYMQNATHINNPRIVSRFGVFFVTEPHMDSLPKALLLEKKELGEDPAKFLNYYTIVVQNFRLISTEGEVLWPKSQSIHSIAAMAQDKDGRILMMFCRFQLSPADFASLIMALPLDCSAAMYLEGGSPAGLLLKSFNGNGPSIWRGKRNSILALDGPADAPLPNVLGIRPRPKESAPHAD